MSNNMENVEELIEKAKGLSKEKFLRFAKNIVGIDTDTLEHLWSVPIIASYQDDSIISTTLSTKDEDDIIEILDDCIEEELGESDSAFIIFEKLAPEFSEEEIEEYKEKIRSSKVEEPFNAVIVYDEEKLKKFYDEVLKENQQNENEKSKEYIDEYFLKEVTTIFMHERCHQNANVLCCDIRRTDLDEHINGAEISLNNSRELEFFVWEDNNEVLIDTLARMMSEYQEGDSIEDCLYKVVEKRKGKMQYDNFDDKLVLSIYALFPESITRWAMLGAYDDVRVNLLKEKIDSIYGRKSGLLGDTEIIRILGEYSKKIKDTLSNKQIQIIEMLGVKELKKDISLQEIKNVATSETAVEQLNESTVDVNSAIRGSEEEKDTVKGEE